MIEKAGPPWTAVLHVSPTLTPEWKLYDVEAATRFSAPAGGLGVRFQVGHQAALSGARHHEGQRALGQTSGQHEPRRGLLRRVGET